MSWFDLPLSWAELERRLSGRPAGQPGSRPEAGAPGPLPGDGGDSPAWSSKSSKRNAYRPQPGLRAGSGSRRTGGDIVPYAELHCHSAFSFLDGASQPEDLVEEAARLGLTGLALTDHGGMYGIVRFAEAAAEVGLPTLFGTEVSLGCPTGPGAAADPAGEHLVVLARDPDGYRRLSRAVSEAHLASGRKGRPVVDLDAFTDRAGGHWQVLTGCRKGSVPAALERGGGDAARRVLADLVDRFGRDNVAVELTDHGHPLDGDRNAALAELARSARLDVVATNNVHYATPASARLAAAMAALRARRSLDEMDGWLPPAGTAYLRSGAEMAARFARFGHAVETAARIGADCSFDLRLVAPKLPDFPVPPGHTEVSWLRLLTGQGAQRRYGPPDRERVAGAYAQLAHELDMIEALGFGGYFLIVHDIVEFCRGRDILCQGRGSAANSAVCYALGITSVDAVSFGLLFERFLAPERDGPPDIDLDIESGRREEVIQYVYGRYGRERAAQVANVITYRPRSAVRDAARALGFSPPDVAGRMGGAGRRRRETGDAAQQDAWSGQLGQVGPSEPAPPTVASPVATPPAAAHHGPVPAAVPAPREPLGDTAGQPGGISAAGPHPAARPAPPNGGGDRGCTDPAKVRGEFPRMLVSDTVSASGAEVGDAGIPAQVRRLAGQFLGLPRHLGIHSGGMVICDRPVTEVVPVEWARMPGRTVTQWDKDDCAAAGLVKFDLLGLGMLSMLHGAFDLIRDHHGRAVDLDAIPPEDPAVYDMLCAADSVGVFQVESRAQMATLPRLRPRRFYDLVIEVALIRPGPIQGGSVHPYIRRRNGVEEVTYLHPLLRRSLAKTLGVPLFQEQLMQMAVDVAGFTPAEADQLRRAMGAKRSTDRIGRLRARFYEGMAANGITGAAADDLYTKVVAFADYGFPESHAVSFAFLVYASSWVKLYYPAVFCAALLNAQPMGFYSPQSLVADARRHGVVVRGPDVNASGAGARLEPLRPGRPDTAQPALSSPPTRLALRLGMAGVRHLGVENARRIAGERDARGPYANMADLVRRTGLGTAHLESLATAGAFGCFGLSRRDALWSAGAVAQTRPDRLEGMVVGADVVAVTQHLTGMTGAEEAAADLWATGITPGSYPTQFVRGDLDAMGVVVAAGLSAIEPNRRVLVAGVVTHRQRPATAGGTTFVNLEDETGLVNVICSRGVWVRHRVAAGSSAALVVRGRLEKADGVVNVVAERMWPLSLVASSRSRDFQ